MVLVQFIVLNLLITFGKSCRSMFPGVSILKTILNCHEDLRWKYLSVDLILPYTNKPDGGNNKKGVQSHLFMEPTLFFPINIEESEKICRNQMNFSTYTIFYFMGTKGLTSMAQLFFVSILL